MLEREKRPTIEELDERVRSENLAIRRVYDLIAEYHIKKEAEVSESARESHGKREHELASEIDEALGDVVSLRDAVAFRLTPQVRSLRHQRMRRSS